MAELIRQLQSEEAIDLRLAPAPRSYIDFLADFQKSWWVYAILLSSALEIVLVVKNYENGPGWILRVLLGLALLGLMPGFATVQIIFPGSRLPLLEQLLLSIFLSVMISIASGVALGADYRFTGTSSVLVLGAYAIVSGLFGGYRVFSSTKRSVVSQ